MALIATFYGILVYMYVEAGGQHKMPHMHIKYQNDFRVYTLDGELLTGSPLPGKQRKILDAWVALHEDEIVASYEALQEGKVVEIGGISL